MTDGHLLAPRYGGAVLNIDAVGKRGVRFRFPVDETKVRELARATFSTQEAYLVDERPVVPPTFMKLSQMVWEPPGSSAVDLVGYDPQNPPLHAEQEFTFCGPPPRAGTVLYGQTLVESIEERASRSYGTLTYVTIATIYEDADGRTVATARSTSVVRPLPGTTEPDATEPDATDEPGAGR